MTIKELATMVRHLDWKRDKAGSIRCANGDCPVLAAYRIVFPWGELVGKNGVPHTAGAALGLSYDDVSKVVATADTPPVYDIGEWFTWLSGLSKASEILALVHE